MPGIPFETAESPKKLSRGDGHETGRGKQGCRTIRIGLGNCFSLRNKVQSVLGMMVEDELDILALTETWLKQGETAVAAEVAEWKHTLVSAPRKGKKGGGVAFMVRNKVKFSRCNTSHKSFECLEIFVKGTVGVRLSVIYRTGNDYGHFITEFGAYLNSFVSKGGIPVIMGDFNVRFQDDSDRFTQKLKDCC